MRRSCPTLLAIVALYSAPALAEDQQLVLDDFDSPKMNPWACTAGIELSSGPGSSGRGLQLQIDQAPNDAALIKPFTLPSQAIGLTLDARINVEGFSIEAMLKDEQGWIWKTSRRMIGKGNWKTLSFNLARDSLKADWRLGWWKNQKPERRKGLSLKMTPPLRLVGLAIYGPDDKKAAATIDNLRLSVKAEVPVAIVQRSVIELPHQGDVSIALVAATKAISSDLQVQVVSRNGEAVQMEGAKVRVLVPPGKTRSIEIPLKFDRPGIYQLRITGPGLDQKASVQVVSSLSGPEAVRAAMAQFPRKDFTTGRDDSPAKLNQPIWQNVSSDATLYVSELSPAWLMHNNATNSLELFAGGETWGLGGPTRLAIPTADGAKVFSRGAVPAEALAAMNRSWVLVWFAGAKGYDRWDAPYLVSLQHKPRAMALSGEGLQIDFPDTAGYAAILPLYGGYKPPQRGATMFVDKGLAPANVLPFAWADSLPEHVEKRCDFWAAVTKAYPVYCDERFAIDAPNDEVVIRSKYTWLMIEDDWRTEPIKFAPISYVLGNCYVDGQFPVRFDQQVHNPEYPTSYGPYVGVIGADVTTARIKVLQYIHDAVDLPAPSSKHPAIAKAIDEMTRFVSEQAKPYWLENVYDGNVCWGVWRQERWANSNMRYLLNDGVKLAGKLARQQYGAKMLYWPGQYKEADVGVNRTFLFFPAPGWGFQGDAGKITNALYYTAWCYAYASGDFQLLADRWDEVVSRLNCVPFTMSWARFGRDAIAEGGDEAPPMLGLARLGYVLGDMDAYAYGAYLFARELTHHYVKVAAGIKHFRKYQPIHPLINWDWTGSDRWPQAVAIPDRVNVTNMFAESAGWIPGGPPAEIPLYSPSPETKDHPVFDHPLSKGRYPTGTVQRGQTLWNSQHPMYKKPYGKLPDVLPWSYYGSGQWVPKWARFDAEDVFAFYRDYRLEACRREFDTWLNVEFPDLPELPAQPRRQHDGYPASPWRLLQLRTDILGEDLTEMTRRYPPEKWTPADQTFYQAVIRSAGPRRTVEILPRLDSVSPWIKGIQRDSVSNPSWNNPVQTPAGIVVNHPSGPDKGKPAGYNWPAPTIYFARAPSQPSPATGTGHRWSFGYIRPGPKAPALAEKQAVNWVLDMYRFHLAGAK